MCLGIFHKSILYLNQVYSGSLHIMYCLYYDMMSTNDVMSLLLNLMLKISY